MLIWKIMYLFLMARTRSSNRFKIWNRHIDSWNALTNDVVDAGNVNKFKKLLYKHLNAR